MCRLPESLEGKAIFLLRLQRVTNNRDGAQLVLLLDCAHFRNAIMKLSTFVEESISTETDPCRLVLNSAHSG